MNLLKKISHFGPLFFVVFIIILTYSFLITAPKNFVFGEFVPFWIYNNQFSLYSFIHFGQLGLWDNFNGLGIPAMADLNSIFYPVTVLGFLISNPVQSINLQALFHLCLAGIVFYLFLRSFKCSIFSSITGTAVYVLNFYVAGVLKSGFLGEIYNLVFMPLAVLFLWKALFEERYLYAVLAGVSLAMEIISMSVYPVYFLILLLFVEIVFYFFYSFFIAKKKFFPLVKKSIVILFLTFSSAIGLSAIKLLPVLEYKSISIRNSVPLYGTAYRHWDALDWHNFYKFVPPIPMNDYTFQSFGILNFIFLILIIIAIVKKTKESIFFFIASIISIWAAFGNNAFFDLQRVLYYVVPGLNTNELPVRFLITEHFTTAVLIGIGLHYAGITFLNIISLLKKRLLIVIPIVFFLSIIFSLVLFVKFDIFAYISQQSTASLIPTGQNNIFNEKIRSFVQSNKDPVHIVSYYVPVAAKNVLAYGSFVNKFMMVNRVDPALATTYQWLTFQDTSEYKKLEYLRKKYLFLSLFNTKYVVTNKFFDDYPNNYLIPLYSHTNGIHVNEIFPEEDSGTIYQIKSYLPYVSEADNAILLTGDNDFRDFHSFAAQYLYLDKFFDPMHEVIYSDSRTNIHDYAPQELAKFNYVFIEKDNLTANGSLQKNQTFIHFNETFYADLRSRSQSIMTDNPAKWLSVKNKSTFENIIDRFSPVVMPSKIVINTLTPEYLRFTVSMLRKRSYFTIANAYYPGWNAYVDGKRSPLYMADGIRQGIIVNGEGVHTIELKFQPVSFYIGCLVSIISLLLIFVLFKYRLRVTSGLIKLIY